MTPTDLLRPTVRTAVPVNLPTWVPPRQAAVWRISLALGDSLGTTAGMPVAKPLSIHRSGSHRSAHGGPCVALCMECGQNNTPALAFFTLSSIHSPTTTTPFSIPQSSVVRAPHPEGDNSAISM